MRNIETCMFPEENSRQQMGKVDFVALFYAQIDRQRSILGLTLCER